MLLDLVRCPCIVSGSASDQVNQKIPYYIQADIFKFEAYKIQHRILLITFRLAWTGNLPTLIYIPKPLAGYLGQMRAGWSSGAPG